MAVTYYPITSERNALQTKLSSTTLSLADLRHAFYGNGAQSTVIRQYLMSQLGVTGYLATNDLWRSFFVSKGVSNQTSLSDMAKIFFNTIGF